MAQRLPQRPFADLDPNVSISSEPKVRRKPLRKGGSDLLSAARQQIRLLEKFVDGKNHRMLVCMLTHVVVRRRKLQESQAESRALQEAAAKRSEPAREATPRSDEAAAASGGDTQVCSSVAAAVSSWLTPCRSPHPCPSPRERYAALLLASP